jgi:hypothetical protein
MAVWPWVGEPVRYTTARPGAAVKRRQAEASAPGPDAPGSGRFYNPAGFDAIGTDHHSFGPAVLERAHILQVGIESLLGFIVSMADIVADQRLFATNFAHF